MSSVISNLTEWLAAAAKYGAQMHEQDTWPQIRMGSEEHKAWQSYFREIRLPLPTALANIHMNKAQTWTAPCRWPGDLKFLINVGQEPDKSGNVVSLRSTATPTHPFLVQKNLCYRTLKALAINIRDRDARVALLRFPVDVRKAALAMFGPDEPKPALAPIQYQDKKGRVLSSGEPVFLPDWDGPTPPGGPGGNVTQSLDEEVVL